MGRTRKDETAEDRAEPMVQMNIGVAKNVWSLLRRKAKQVGVTETNLVRLFIANGLGVTQNAQERG